MSRVYDMEQLKTTWAPILEHADLEPIKDSHRTKVTATLLENTVREVGVANEFASQILRQLFRKYFNC